MERMRIVCWPWESVIVHAVCIGGPSLAKKVVGASRRRTFGVGDGGGGGGVGGGSEGEPAESGKNRQCSITGPIVLSTAVVAEADSQNRITRSRPIAIELPPRRRRGNLYTPTPPEPLSARGDLLGGYFPLHEEFQRSHKTHPFHYEGSATKSGALGTTIPAPRSPQYSPLGHVIVEQPPQPEHVRAPAAADSPHISMPLGKYHPSNYKNKVKIPEKIVTQPAPVPNQPKHSRQRSEIKRKLQQYQRDMVEQAALASRMQVPGIKPISPRLLPLSSPGPVTPIELEESMGYLSVGSKSGYPARNLLDPVSMLGQPKGSRATP